MSKTIAIVAATLLSASFVLAQLPDINTSLEKFKNQATHIEAMQEVETIGAPAADGLKAIFSDEKNEQYARSDALIMLGKIKSGDDRIYLEKILQSDSNKFNRDSAVVALSNWCDKQSIPVLKNALQDSSGFVRMRAAWALANLGDTSGKGAAMEGIKSNDFVTQGFAVDAIDALQDKTIISQLKENLNSANQRIRQYSTLAIKRLEVQGLSLDQKRQYLKETLKDRQPKVNEWAAQELANDNTTASINILKETAKDGTIAGCRSAYCALQMLVSQKKLTSMDVVQ